MDNLFIPEIWDDYVLKVEKSSKKRLYPHFDPVFDFSSRKEEIKSIICDQKQMANHHFKPFLKILSKTPRYRYQAEIDDYNLEMKIRPIAFAAHKDSYIYGYYSHLLTHLYQNYIRENGFGEVVLAYRNDLNSKCNIQFSKEAFDEVSKYQEEHGECSVIALDIKGYFDNIDHKVLHRMWSNVLGTNQLPKDHYKIYKSVTNYSYSNWVSLLKHFGVKKGAQQEKPFKKTKCLFDLLPFYIKRDSFKENMKLLRQKKLITANSFFNEKSGHRERKSKGIPQGSPISAVLSNIYLLNFDERVQKKAKQEGFFYRRYCDDLFIICRPDQVNNLKDYLMNLIETEYGLIIQDRKTEVVDIRESPEFGVRSFKRKFDEATASFISTDSLKQNFGNVQYLGFEFNGKDVFIRPSSVSRYFRKMKDGISRAAIMAYQKNSKPHRIFKKRLHSRYTHLGKRNFLSYALNASKKYYYNSKGEKKEGFNSPKIKAQISRHMKIFDQELAKSSRQIARLKKSTTIKY